MFSLLLAVIYVAFMSLGLPDSLLGSAWPSIYPEMAIPVSYAGIISAIVALGTIISSLCSDRLISRFGPGKITAVSVGTTAFALFGFSISGQFWQLCLFAIPYGLGAGSVDASLNNYVALHYASSHMSWLHCMWGLGTTIGPYIMGYALTADLGWHSGYRIISILQIVLSTLLFLSLPLWKKSPNEASASNEPTTVLSIREIIKIPGAKEVMVAFFCYCALEQTALLWSGSYLNLHLGMNAETAASFASLFCIGITVGRAASGFIAMKLHDTQMIRLGQGIILAGVAAMVLPLGDYVAMAGLVLIGLGCAPIYPCVIHSTPEHFGAERSQALIGVQMASAYTGTCLMPPLFGLIARHCSIGLMPLYLFLILALMFVTHEGLVKKTKHQ